LAYGIDKLSKEMKTIIPKLDNIVFPTKTFFGLIVFLTKTILKIAHVSATEVGNIPVLYVAMTLLVLALTMLSMFEPELRIYS